jgi:hypothetical protein
MFFSRTMRTLVLAAAALGCVAAAAAPAAMAASTPINVTQEDLVGAGFHMNTNVNLAPSGQLDAVVHTWTTNWGLGFTGGVYVLLRNADGSIIGVTQLHTYGVDAKSVFWGTSSRTDYFTEYFDPRVAQATTSVQIIQQHTPKDRLPAILAQVQQIYDQAHSTCQYLHLCN